MMMDPGILPVMTTLENVPVKPMSLVTNASSVLLETLDSQPVMVNFLIMIVHTGQLIS